MQFSVSELKLGTIKEVAERNDRGAALADIGFTGLVVTFRDHRYITYDRGLGLDKWLSSTRAFCCIEETG